MFQVKKKPGIKILAPLPDRDFDPTESEFHLNVLKFNFDKYFKQVAVPWKILQHFGMQVVFATEKGAVPKADPTLPSPDGVIMGTLGAEWEARFFYSEMEKDDGFLHPIKWEDIDVQAYDGLFLCGGHAGGMKQYLESKALQQKIVEIFSANKMVAAVCHGALLLARSMHNDRSVLAGRKTTCLPKYMENMAYYLTRMKHGRLYRTYEKHCEDEVADLVGRNCFDAGPMSLGTRGTLFDNSSAFICKDGNYFSARWPGDAYLLGREFGEALLKEKC